MGQTLVGVVALYLLLRLWQWILRKRFTSWTTRLLVAVVAAYGSAVLIGGYVYADGQSSVLIVFIMILFFPAVVAGLLEAVRLYRKAARVAATDSSGRSDDAQRLSDS